MPLKNYGVLKGSIIDRRLGSSQRPHFQLRVVENQRHWRVAINVKSAQAPSEVAYHVADPFEHPITAQLKDLAAGFHEVERKPEAMGLDFIRKNLIPDLGGMTALPANVNGPDNDLNEKLDVHVQRAVLEEGAVVHAFGERWGPEPDKEDAEFHFLPGNGIHDIHMNQGNSGDYEKDNGVYQDGGLIFHFPSNNRWVAIFTRFQSQAIHTDDTTGFPLGQTPAAGEDANAKVRIIAALVNGKETVEVETVTLLNVSDEPQDLTGWMLADKNKNKMTLKTAIAPGKTEMVILKDGVVLANKGGIITLLDKEGLKVHGVSYTEAQADRGGWTIPF